MALTFTMLSLVTAAAASGCVCTCVTASAEVDKFEAACVEQGGRVHAAEAQRRLCVADADVIATWVADEDAGDDADDT